LQHYWKANFVKELTPTSIKAHAEYGPKVPAINSTMHMYSINGAAHQVAPDETAFAYRDATFATVIAGMWPDPAQNKANIKWVRDYYDATSPESESGGYINFMSDDDQGRIKDNYKGNYKRLVDVKRKYDPDNLFHVNQNIKP
jgi:FAD/FMN-containing dehydrogenase